MKKYTIQDLREGKCAAENDETWHEIHEVLKKAWPECSFDYFLGTCRYYMKDCDNENSWYGSSSTNLPTQKVSEFLEPSLNEMIAQIEKKGESEGYKVNIILEATRHKLRFKDAHFIMSQKHLGLEFEHNQIQSLARLVLHNKDRITKAIEDILNEKQ